MKTTIKTFVVLIIFSILHQNVRAHCSVTIYGNSQICQGGTAILTTMTTGPIKSYYWTTGAITQTIAVTPAKTTTYTVSVVDFEGDTSIASTEVTVNPIPAVIITPSSATICQGQITTLTANGGCSYQWNTGLSVAMNTVSPTTTTVYTVTATSIRGCVSVTSAVVAVNPLPIVTANSNSPVEMYSIIQLSSSATGSCLYHWTGPNGFNSVQQNPTIQNSIINMTGTYSVIATTPAGCISEASTVVEVSKPK